MVQYTFRSAFEGEECQCNRCVTLGMGEDSFHPCTSEFWPVVKGHLRYAQCRTCIAEVAKERARRMEFQQKALKRKEKAKAA